MLLNTQMKITEVAHTRQVILVTTRAEVVAALSTQPEITENVFASSWHTPLSFDPPLYAIAVNKKGHSLKILQKSRAFVVNFMPYALKDKVLYCGRNSGEHIDKFKEAGLEKVEADKVDCPRLKDALGYLECTVVNEIEAGDHIIFIGEVLTMQLVKEGNRIFQVIGDIFTTTKEA